MRAASAPNARSSQKRTLDTRVSARYTRLDVANLCHKSYGPILAVQRERAALFDLCRFSAQPCAFPVEQSLMSLLARIENCFACSLYIRFREFVLALLLKHSRTLCVGTG